MNVLQPLIMAEPGVLSTSPQRVGGGASLRKSSSAEAQLDHHGRACRELRLWKARKRCTNATRKRPPELGDSASLVERVFRDARRIPLPCVPCGRASTSAI